MDLSGATGKVNLLLVATLLLMTTATAQAFSFCFSFGGGGGSRGNAGLYNYPLPPPGFAPGGYVPYAYSPAAPDLLYDYYPPVRVSHAVDSIRHYHVEDDKIDG